MPSGSRSNPSARDFRASKREAAPGFLRAPLRKAGRWARALRADLALLDAGRLARQVAQVEETAAADFAAALHLDLLDARRVDREGPFHADAVGALANREGRLGAARAAADADTLEDLDALLLALDDDAVDTQGVARPE